VGWSKGKITDCSKLHVQNIPYKHKIYAYFCFDTAIFLQC